MENEEEEDMVSTVKEAIDNIKNDKELMEIVVTRVENIKVKTINFLEDQFINFKKYIDSLPLDKEDKEGVDITGE